MNPAALLYMKADLKRFQEEHPKFTAFLQYASEHALKEGNVVVITVRQPDGSETRSNLRLSENDVRMLTNLLEIMKTEQ